MKLQELIDPLTNIRKECNYESHPMTKDWDVSVWVRDDPTINLEIDYIEPVQLFGCGCWTTANICLKKKLIDKQ